MNTIKCTEILKQNANQQQGDAKRTNSLKHLQTEIDNMNKEP